MAPKNQSFTGRQYMKNRSYEIFHYKEKNPKDVPVHHHEFYEIYFFLSGSVQYNIESKNYLLTPGDILLIQPMQLHQPVFEENAGHYERIVLWLDGSFLDQFGLAGEPLNACFHAAAPGHAGLLRPDDTVRQLLQFYLELLIQETDSQSYGKEICCLSYLALILSQLCRLSSQEPQEIESSQTSQVVYRVLEYINGNYREELTLDSLANTFFVSKYHLSREFSRVTGSSVHRYITQKRLIIAKQLMVNGVSSTDVCQQCGFGDYSSFYRAFKSTYNISPREFVLRLKKSTAQSEDLAHSLRELIENQP